MSKISVIIADDHRLIRTGIKLLLEDNDEIELVAEAENGEELIELVSQFEPDVILLDLTMPKLDGLASMDIILKKYPDTSIIILSMHENPEFVQKSVDAGALSYLLKNVSKEELINTIKTVTFGKKSFSPIINEMLVKGQLEARKLKSESVKITRREKEVLECLLKGMSTKQMADVLFLSGRTVESHRLRLLKKFDAQNSAELIRIVLEKKILKL